MAAAELKLQVGLDLAFFRQQLAQLGSVAVGYQMPINVKFDRLNIQQELNRLATNINRRKYRLEIATNIKSETEAAQDLDAALDALKDKEINVKFTGTGDLNAREANKIRTALRASILTNGGKIKVPATIKAAITQDDVTAFTRAAQAKLKEIALNVRADITSSADGLDTKEVRKIRVALRNAVLSNGGKIKIPATIQPSISNDEVASFRKLVQEKFKGITVTVGVDPQVSSKGSAAQASQGQPRGYETALESIKKLNPEQLRSRAVKSLGEESRTAQQISNWVDILQADKGMGRGDKNKQLAAIRNVLAKALAESVGQSIEAKLQPLRGQKAMEAPRSASNINKILDPIANFTQNPGTARRMLRMLPESNISTNTLDVASRQARYYENTPSAREMQGKIKGFDPVMKAIAGDFANYTKGLSPSNPWVGNISRGIARMVSAAATSPQAQKLLPAAGQSSSSKMMRSAFAGLPPIQAPSVGQENAPLSRAATYSLNKARRTLGMPIGPSSVYAPNPFAGAATVPPTATVSGGFGLPPAGTTSNYSATARRAAWAQAYQQSRPMQAPSMPPPMGGGGAPPTPPAPPGGGRGGFGSFGGFRGAMANISLPGAGLVRELGGEFAMAAKQVLLFGTAYKALAFLTDFPSKVGEAVAQLQTFRNTLQAITPNADEFQKSNQFILDTVDKYNTPLQSARDGFTNLYASMAPAGFKGDEIRNIFSGISQGAATFGMSADKVDRVNYAFAQMASKGQVMSEELKGQLGDVLPGAVAIFAKAAGFTGPNAMVDFTKAMEAGRYKGEAMKQLLINVGIVMKDKFAKGAEGAAQNFQGQMNAMANATKKLYEAFEPAGNLFSSKVIAPFTEGLIVITDGFNAFFTGVAAKTAGGFALSQELERLKPTFEGLRANIAGLIPSFQMFGSVLLNVAKALAIVAGNPITGFLLKVYVNVLLVNTAFTLLGGRILVGLITNIGLATSRLFAMNAAFFALQRTSAVTNSTLAGTQLQMMLLQRNATGVVGPVNALLRSLLRMAAIGAIAIAITIAITNANELRDAELRLARLRGERDPVGPDGPKPVMTPARRFTGASRETVQSAKAAQAPLVIQYRKELKVLQQQLLTARAIAASSEDNAQASVANTQARTAQARIDAKLLDIQNAQGILNLNPSSFKTAEEQQAASLKLAPIPGATGATGSKGSGADDAKRIAEQIKQQLKSAQDLKFEQQNRLTLLRAENDFTKAFTGFSIQRLEIKRRYDELLEKSQSKEETTALQESRAAEYKQSRLTLQQRINELLKQAQAPLDDAVESIKNQAAFEREYGELIKNGTNPELAKQLISIRKGYDESVKLLEPALAAAQAAVTKATAEGASATEIQKYREELERIEAIRKGLAGKKAEGEAAAQEVGKGSTPMFGDKLRAGLDAAREELAKLIDVENILVGAANSIGDAFGSAFKGIVDGSMTAQQALAGFFQNLSNYFADMVTKMIAEYLKMQVIEGIMNIFSMFSPGFGSGIAPGPVAKSAGVKYSATKMGPAFANGGIAYGGFQAFASGGIVTGPTLGLVGEGKYNEAVIPLPDGKSVPVDLGGMSGGGAITSNIVINMNSDGQSSSNANGSNSAELGRKIEGAVKQVMVAELRPGGILAGRR